MQIMSFDHIQPPLDLLPTLRGPSPFPNIFLLLYVSFSLLNDPLS